VAQLNIENEVGQFMHLYHSHEQHREEIVVVMIGFNESDLGGRLMATFSIHCTADMKHIPFSLENFGNNIPFF